MKYCTKLHNLQLRRYVLPCLLLKIFLTIITTDADDYALSNEKNKSLMVALGCFWCAEQAFQEYVPGVVEVISGYACGTEAAGTTDAPKCNDYPTYTNHPGHYEVILIEYDPTQTDYETLVRHAWRNLDPFDGIGQFCDKGTSYLPAIFFADEEEHMIADKVLGELLQTRPDWNEDQIAVGILPRPAFWTAEDYHQDYYDKNPAKYKFYKYLCGRTQRLIDVWGEKEYNCYHDYPGECDESSNIFN